MNKITQEIIWNLAVLVLGAFLKYLFDIFLYYHLQGLLPISINFTNVLIGILLIILRYIIIAILSVKNKNLQVVILLLLFCFIFFIILLFFHIICGADDWVIYPPTKK